MKTAGNFLLLPIPSISARPPPPKATPSPTPEEAKEVTTIPVPDFVKVEKESVVKPPAKNSQLTETIEEAVRLVESSMVDLDQLSPESLKNALQLVYHLRVLEKLDGSAITPSKIRQITNLAVSLKDSKDAIVLQKEKLRKLETKLNERALLALDSKLELKAKLFDEFIHDLELTIVRLTEKGEKLIKHYGKKGGKDFRARQKIRKEGKTLAQEVDILKKIGELPQKEFDQVKKAYIHFQKARDARKNKLVKQFSTEISAIIGIDRKQFLILTREKKLKTSLEELFRITSKN